MLLFRSPIRSPIRSPFRSLSRALWLAAIPAALLTGLMIATAGIAVYPPLANVAAPLVCDGRLVAESQSWQVRPGESGITRTFSCQAEGNARDVSLRTIFAAFLVYSVAAFALILPFMLLLRRKLDERIDEWEEVAAPAIPAAPGEPARDTDSLHEAARGGDISAILSLVADAVKNGKRDNVPIRRTTLDARGDAQGDRDAERATGDHDGDAAARLAELRDLFDRDLITEADYRGKKAEILDQI
jgi:hypothetical protein